MRDAVGARVPHGGTEAPGVVHRHCVARLHIALGESRCSVVG